MTKQRRQSKKPRLEERSDPVDVYRENVSPFPGINGPMINLEILIPYRVRPDGTVYPLREFGGRSYFYAGERNIRMNDETARSWSETFLKFLGIEHYELGMISPQIRSEPLKALDELDPINVLRVEAYVYYNR